MKKFSAIIILVTILLSGSKSFAEKKELKIIALAPIITSDLILLGLEKNITGNTTYCINTDEHKPAKIGNVSNFSTETIISLSPDIVFCGELNHRGKIDKLKKMGIKIVFIPYPKTFQQMCDNLTKIAETTNTTDKAKQLITRATEKINTLRTEETASDLKVFVQIGADPLFTANKDSFINELIFFAGGKNIAQESSTGMYSKEAVIAANPDVILISEMGINGLKEKEKWLQYTSLSAVKHNNIYIINEYMLCSPNIIKLPETLQEIKNIFQRSRK